MFPLRTCSFTAREEVVKAHRKIPCDSSVIKDHGAAPSGLRLM
jgi:hypothetical protein